MSVYCKLIFGVHTDSITEIKVTGQPGTPAPPLLIRKMGVAPDQSIAFDDGVWKTTLAPGDYIVRIDLPSEEHWFDGEVSFTLAPESICVINKGDPKEPESQALTKGWQTSGLASDPKDPWPPPGTLVSVPSLAWFTTTLHALKQDILPPPPRAGLWSDEPLPRRHMSSDR